MSTLRRLTTAFAITACITLACGTSSAYPERFGVPFTSLEACVAPSEVSQVIIGDWNGDGRKDLAVSGTGKVSTFLGTGAGTFLPREELTSGFSGPLGMAAADMQGDGIADIVVANYPDQVRVILKEGPGSPTIFTQTTGPYPYEVAVGDLNHDGRQDVITSNRNGNSISVLLGNGDGTLAAKTDYPTGLEPYGVALGDLNGDGHLDVVTANSTSNTITIWGGTGTGTFANRTDLPSAAPNPTDVVLLRLNGDALLDIVTCNLPGLSVWLGAGGGAFSTPTSVPGVLSGRIATADFNRDGNQDILVGNSGLEVQLGTLWSRVGDGLIHLGDGAGSFGSAIRFESGGFPFGLAPGDLNGDSYMDVAVASWKHDVSVTLGRSDGTFGVNRETNTGLRGGPLAVVDMTGDSKPDLVQVDNSTYQGVLVFSGDGTGGFTSAYSSTTPGTGTMSMAVADLDGDGDRDVAVARRGYEVSVLKNLGGLGGFAAPVEIFLSSSPTAIAAGDLNHDGKPELVTADTTGTGEATVLLNSGTGTFSVLGEFSFMNPPSIGLAAVAIADMNADTHPDVIVAGESQYVGIFLGDGSGSLVPSSQHNVGDHPRELAVADFDSNGLPDIAVACDGEVSVILTVSPGTFAATLHYALAGDHLGIVVGEMNQDGMLDLAVTNKEAGTVTVLRGNGDGTFDPSPLQRWGAGFQVTTLALADGTIDGLPDLYVAEPYYVQELLNLGATAPYDPAPSVRAPKIAFVEVGGTLTFDVTAFDLNGDPITSLTADALPGGATFVPNGSNTAGTFAYSPGPGQEGTYAVDFIASNVLSGDALTFIKVRPAGTSITGTLLWTPDNGASGTYLVCFGASGAGGNATMCTSITVNPSGLAAPLPSREHSGDRLAPGAGKAAAALPAFIVPATASVTAGQTLALDVSVSNATTLTVDTSGLPANNGATFVVGRQPSVSAPSIVYAVSGSPISINVNTSDPDGDPIGSLTADFSAFPSGNPPSFTLNQGVTPQGTLAWTPAIADDGNDFGITFYAANALVGLAPTLIRVGTRPAAYYKLNGSPNEETGGAPLAPLAGATAAYTTGRLGQGADFNGTGSHAVGITPGTSLDFSSGFTAECWVLVRPPVPASGSMFLIARSATQSGGFWPNWHFEIIGGPITTGRCRFAVQTASGGNFFVDTTQRIDDGTFHHLAATFDGATIQLYLDGVFQSSSGAPGLALGVVGGLFQLGGGARFGTDFTYLNGVVDEVRVWHVVRSQSEIASSKDLELFTTVTGAGTTTTAPRFALGQNRPNPFNPQTEIQYEIDRKSRVTLRVFDLSGRWIRTLVDASMPPGRHRIGWDGRDGSGRPVASGAYLYRVNAGESFESKKMVLLR